jgi:hypothetical protein
MKKWFDKEIDLQLFAEGDGDPASVETPENNNDDDKPDEKTKPKPQPQPKYTDDDVDKIINRKFAEWAKNQEKKTSEAERLGKMTAEEKAAERMKALEDKLHGYEVAAARAEMTKQARAILHDKNINVGDELLANLISEDAESTKASVESFVSLFKDAVEKAVKEAYKGETPRKGGGSATLTKEQILAVQNRAERQRLINENLDLFK